MARSIARRDVMRTGGGLISALALDGCVGSPARQQQATLPPVRASMDRLIKITVCTRPFRADGPRLDVEKIGDKIVVHNYGHGGSGWSLSWGSSTIATSKAMATGAREIGVIGCGALGLTSATLLQRAGYPVTIYAKDRPPQVRSSLASGLWTPDSRICLEERATPEFRQLWQTMRDTSFATYQNYLGLPGEPVEWIDFYRLAGGPDRPPPAQPSGNDMKFAELQADMPDVRERRADDLTGAANPFPRFQTRRTGNMMFNLIEYQHLLYSDFLTAGGRIETREFHTPADFVGLPQKVLVNCTGYGARALFKDGSVIPVRGQLARLIPQAEITYGLYYNHVSFVPRRDGLVVQSVGPDERVGYGDNSTEPNREEAEQAVATIASIFEPAAASA
jgi:D-amino-acid oxidase